MHTLVDFRTPAPKPATLANIVESGLCMGCGLCGAIAGHDAIDMVTTPEGRVRPLQRGEITPDAWTQILATCPGINVTVDRGADHDGGVDDLIWGHHRRIVLAHAADTNLRFRATSGGVLSALGSYLLRSAQVEFLLQVRASVSEPMRSETILSWTPEDVISCSGVRYGPTAPLSAVREALDRQLPFAFIGKPCDVVGLRLLGRLDPRVGEYCKFALSLQCGGGPEFIKSRDLVRSLGLHDEEVSLLRYRGYGNPGRTRIETRDGRAFELTYQEMWDDQSKWCSHSRCRICPDGIGESADIVVGDHWPGCDPSGEDAGFNSVMIRTEKGLQLMAAAAEAGDLRIVREISLEEMSRHQPHQVTKKEEVWGRLAGLRAANHLIPNVEGLRLREIASGQSRSKNLAAARGARRRLGQGRFTEPPVQKEQD